MCVVWLIVLSLGKTSCLEAQHIATYDLQEVLVSDVPWERVLKQVIKNLSANRNNEDKWFYGNARYAQQVYQDGTLLLHLQMYGWYAQEAYIPVGENLFQKVFNRRNLYYIPVCHLLQTWKNSDIHYPGADLPVNFYLHDWLNGYRWMYPCFGDKRNYRFDLVGFDGRYYTIRFETSARHFPNKTFINASGELVIDRDGPHLAQIHFHHLISCINPVHLIYKVPYRYQKQAYEESLSLDFMPDGVIRHAHHAIHWILPEDRNAGILSMPLPFPAHVNEGSTCRVEEDWTIERIVPMSEYAKEILKEDWQYRNSERREWTHRSVFSADTNLFPHLIPDDRMQNDSLQLVHLASPSMATTDNASFTLSDKCVQLLSPLLYKN